MELEVIGFIISLVMGWKKVELRMIIWLLIWMIKWIALLLIKMGKIIGGVVVEEYYRVVLDVFSLRD